LVNWVSRKFTAARISLVKPLGAKATLASQFTVIVNAVGEAGSVGRETGVVAIGVVVPARGVPRRASGSASDKDPTVLLASNSAAVPASTFRPGHPLSSPGGDEDPWSSNNPEIGLPNGRIAVSRIGSASPHAVEFHLITLPLAQHADTSVMHDNPWFYCYETALRFGVISK